MKNRVLSIILSFGIILSNFSSSFAVIAEDGIGTTEPETTVATETNTEPTTEEQSETQGTSSQAEENSDANQEESQDDEPSNQETVEVKIVLNKNSIYYGQELPFDEAGIVDGDFYKFVDATDEQKPIESDLLKSVVSLKAVLVEGQVASNNYANYRIDITIDSKNLVEGNTTYNVAADSLYFSINGYYSPGDVQVTSYIDNGALYIKSENNQFAIGKNSDISSFSEESQDGIAVSELEYSNGTYTYYLRNIDTSEENENYHAISSPRQISIEYDMELSSEAKVSNIIFSQINGISAHNAYNDSLTITVTGKAKADSVVISISNNGQDLCSEVAEKVDTENGKNVFTLSYTFELNDTLSIIEINNLTATMSIKGTDMSISSGLTLVDSERNTKNALVLENIKPDVEPISSGKNYAYIKITDAQSGLYEVNYRINNGDWTKPTEGWIDSIQQNNPTFQSGVKEYSFYIYTGKKGHNGKDSIELNVIDCAGNVRSYPDTEDTDIIVSSDGTFPEIDSVSILGASLNSYPYGNYANDDTVLKIVAHDSGHESDDDHGIKKIWLSDSDSQLDYKANIVYKTEKNEETGEDLKTSEVDYYYYELPVGTNIDNLIIHVKDEGFNETSEYFAECLGVQSSLLKIENQVPTGIIDNPTFTNYVDETETNWYGLDVHDGNITIRVSDDQSGIANVVIKDENTVLNSNDCDFTANNEPEYRKEYIFPITETFKDGSHDLTVVVTDNCCNPYSCDLSFRTDFQRPDGTIKFSSSSDNAQPKVININGEDQYWFNGCGAETETVKFDLEISDDNPYSVKYAFVNSISQNVYNSERSYIKSDGTAIYSVEISDTEALIQLENDHYLDVYVTFIDQSGNESANIDPIRFYKDFSYPKINTVTVSKTETGLDKVLRILTFGIYSNNNIKYTVNASDIEFDSGLADDSIIISFGEAEYVMSRDSENTYSYVVEAGDEKVLSGEITVSVTDQYGLKTDRTVHYSEDFDVINGTSEEPYFTLGKKETESKAFMIDKNPPTVSFESLVSDGRERNDGTIWLKDDHDVKFTVTDSNSGLSSIMVIVNGDTDHPLTADSDGKKFLTEEETSNYSKIDDVKKSETYRLSTDNLMESIKTSDGHYIIEVIVTDYAGNQNEKAAIDYYIDKDAPEVGKIEFSILSADDLSEGDVTDAEQYIEKLQYGYYFKTDLIATVNITDKAPSSELNEIEYVLVDYNNGVKGEEHYGKAAITSDPHPGNGSVDSIGTASFTIPANFKGQILVTAYDYVGNESVERTPDLFVVDTPEKHESEEHITITGLGTSSYTDSEGHPLFDTNVDLTVTIIDTMSGIRDISYAISSEQDTQDNKTITINKTGYSVGQDLGDGWTITAMDENLVTEVTRNYNFSADNNNIQLSFAMTDRANNTSDRISDVFSIDQTAPVINVAFDTPAGNNDYYRENRTATITVIERNFDASLINAAITNEIGGTPVISFASNSNTEHIATLTFGEGDYTFGIEGSDRANHVATVNYSGGNERSFHVDMTSPTEIDNFDQFINELNNSFNSDKEMTFTITEHNFVPGQVNIRVYRTAAGNDLTTENREDCTSKYVSADKWTGTGDTHSISFKFTEDYVYQVTISATDASGRTLTEKASPVFEIDKTAPVLKTPTNLDVLVFTNKNTETSATPLEFFDANIASIHYSVVSYQMKLNEDNIGYDMNVDSEDFDVKSDEVVISNEFFNQDGIYEVKSVAYDIAGNESDETTHTFVIQRDTDFLVYIPNSIKANQTGLYKFNEKGIRSADFEDIEIITYITQDKEFEVQVDGNVVEAGDLDVNKDDRRINQVDMYDVTLKNSYISQNYNADTIDTDLTLNAVATDGDTEQVITLGHIYIDNVKPVGEYESALQNLGTFDGFYGMESRTVMIEGVSPDIDVERCEIQLNDTTLKNEEGGFIYDENAHTISFTINKGYTDIRTTLVDKAGNPNNLELVKNVYVGGVFARWWYLFVLGGLAILAIPTGIIIAIMRKKRRPVSF